MLSFSIRKSIEKCSQIFSLEKFFRVRARRAVVLMALQAIASLVIVSKVWLSVPIHQGKINLDLVNSGRFSRFN